MSDRIYLTKYDKLECGVINGNLVIIVNSTNTIVISNAYIKDNKEVVRDLAIKLDNLVQATEQDNVTE